MCVRTFAVLLACDCVLFFFFFFSSRRRHTRFDCDWSSDVCSSDLGYLALGATKGGEDAALTPWQPVPEWGQEMYESRLKMIGGVTGIGFITNDLKRTIADLKKKGVKTAVDGESETFGRFTDPAGHVLFLAQPAKPKVRRAGVS